MEKMRPSDGSRVRCSEVLLCVGLPFHSFNAKIEADGKYPFYGESTALERGGWKNGRTTEITNRGRQF